MPEAILRSKTWDGLKTLLENDDQQESLLNYHLKRRVTRVPSSEMKDLFERLTSRIYGDDRAAKTAADALRKFAQNPTVETLEPGVLQILFEKDILSDQDVRALMTWLFPSVTVDTLHAIGVDPMTLPIFSNSRSMNTNLNEEKKLLFRQALTGRTIPTNFLSIADQKELLRTYGSSKLVEQIHSTIDGQDDITPEEFKQLYEHSLNITAADVRTKK